MGKLLCMSSFLGSGRSPTPLDGADNSLAALVNMDVFDGHTLLPTLAPVAVQGVHQQGVGPGQLVGLVQVLLPPFEGLIRDHRAPVTLHGRAVGRHHLRRQHPLDLIAGANAGQGGYDRLILPVTRFRIRLGQPQGLKGLVETRLLKASLTEPPSAFSRPEPVPGGGA